MLIAEICESADCFQKEKNRAMLCCGLLWHFTPIKSIDTAKRSKTAFLPKKFTHTTIKLFSVSAGFGLRAGLQRK